MARLVVASCLLLAVQVLSGCSGSGDGGGSTSSSSAAAMADLAKFTALGHLPSSAYTADGENAERDAPESQKASGLLKLVAASWKSEAGFLESYAYRFDTKAHADAVFDKQLKGQVESGTTCKPLEGGASGWLILRTDTVLSFHKGDKALFASGYIDALSDSVRTKTGATFVCKSSLGAASTPPPSPSASTSTPKLSFQTSGLGLDVLSVQNGPYPWSAFTVSGDAGCVLPATGNVQAGQHIACAQAGMVNIAHKPSNTIVFNGRVEV